MRERTNQRARRRGLQGKGPIRGSPWWRCPGRGARERRRKTRGPANASSGPEKAEVEIRGRQEKKYSCEYRIVAVIGRNTYTLMLLLSLLLYGTIRSQDPKFPAIPEHLSRFP